MAFLLTTRPFEQIISSIHPPFFSFGVDQGQFGEIMKTQGNMANKKGSDILELLSKFNGQ